MSDKAVFLDRDGTLIEDTGYINNVEMVRLLAGVPEALVHLKRLGYKLIVVSNQSGVARGIIREEVLSQITDRMKQLLGLAGAYLDGIYYCPYHPDGAIEKYRRDTDDRKPKPGMLMQAAREMEIDLTRSWAIGDSYRDVEAGWRAGCRTILLNAPPELKRPRPTDVHPDFEAVNIKEAANIIHRQDLMRKETPAASASPNVAATSNPPSDSEEAGRAPAVTTVERTDVVEEQPIAAPEIAAEPSAPAEADLTGGQRLSAGRTEELLEEAVRHLKGIHQQGLFEEFSALKLAAGVLQMLVLFCAVMAGWIWLSSTQVNQGVFVALGFGILFQLMALTLYISSK